jgi:hypothetical protein
MVEQIAQLKGIHHLSLRASDSHKPKEKSRKGAIPVFMWR